VLAAAGRLGELRGRFETMTKRKQETESEMVRSQGELDGCGKRIEALLKHRQELEQQIEEGERELARINASVAKVTEAEDPNVEAEYLAEKIDTLEKALRDAEESERKRAEEAAAAKKAAEESKRTAEMSREQAQTGSERLRTAVAEAGFEDEEGARRAVADPEEQARLEREVTSVRQDYHSLEKQVTELESELDGGLVSAEELASAEAEWAAEQRDYETCLRERAALGQRIKELEEKVAKAAELSKRQDVVVREHVVYRRLADDLRSENFQAYLLEEAFRELVGGASERLKTLSDRYTLDYREDGFVVLDHDNAGERRSADTLSGGETFLASLALALELSEQVQRAAGAVNLDSLFIDEGFGTLDPETLDTVAVAIETLPVAGRMVGIITHIPELTERLPACIRVEKTPAGSRIIR
jgi:exonuclease SbcC